MLLFSPSCCTNMYFTALTVLLKFNFFCIGIFPETWYFLLAFYRYFRETLDSVIFLRPRWQPCIYHLQMLLNHDGSLLPPLSERGINKMRKHGLASILSAAVPPPGGNVKGLPRVAGILGKRHRPAVISHIQGGILDQAHMRRSQSQERPIVVKTFTPYYSDHDVITCFFPKIK